MVVAELGLALLGLVIVVAASWLRPVAVVRLCAHLLGFAAVLAALVGVSWLVFGLQFGFGSREQEAATLFGVFAVATVFPGSARFTEWLLRRFAPRYAKPR